jgi:dihydrofolate synthase/folylpolyglutamate synthase
MTYEESIDWLFSQFPAYQKVGVLAYKPDLDNVKALCAHFDVNYNSLKCIHIAGTNGKGSTSNYLASFLQENNYKTGLFTSPHIQDFRERIRVDGTMISEERVISFCKEIQANTFEIQPSFFEITFVLALIHFIQSSCDFCVIEVGLGGRLDATNIITPILSVITNVSLDHISILGNTIEEIAFEKAGIIKEKIPVVVGKKDSLYVSIFSEIAASKHSQLFFAEDDTEGENFFPKSIYPYKNERLIRKVIQVLQDMSFVLDINLISKAFTNLHKNTGFYGRFQLISEEPRIIVDAAHNADGINELVKSIQSFNYAKLHIIYGASNDKDCNEIISLFPAESELYLCPFSNSRSLKKGELEQLSKDLRKKVKIFNSIEETFLFCQNTVNKEDTLLITGSFFLLSDFFEFFPKINLQK